MSPEARVGTAYYLDSSVLLAIIFKEKTRIERIQPLLDQAEILLTSELTFLEGQSALSARVGSDVQILAELERTFLSWMDALIIVGVRSATVHTAWALVRRYRVAPGLRPMDGMHLATAALFSRTLESDLDTPGAISGAGNPLLGLTLLTCDRIQHEAAIREGIRSELIA